VEPVGKAGARRDPADPLDQASEPLVGAVRPGEAPRDADVPGVGELVAAQRAGLERGE
jgi:hypothetical protein